MSDFILTKIVLCGFRGFTVKQEITLGHPITLVYGGNRTGKSSLLNAVEWCLFGSQIAAIKYGDIRERDNWEVKNVQSAKCYVECEFTSKASGKKLLVMRSLARGKGVTDLSFQLEGESRSADETALEALLRVSSMDFLRAVHLHQEVIRSLITAPRRDRKEAIDRLLGLSDLRDMVKSLQVQKPKTWTESLDQLVADLSTRLEIALKAKKASIVQDTSELIKLGLNESAFSVEGALMYATELLGRIKSFCEQYQLSIPQLSQPHDLAELESFLRSLPDEIKKLRTQNPVLQNQGGLLTKKNRLEGLRENHVEQVQTATNAEQKIKDLPADRQHLEDLNKDILTLSNGIGQVDAQMREMSQNAQVLDRALNFFRDRLPDEQLTCPICGETSKTVGEWQTHIQTEIEKRHLKPLQGKRDQLRKSLDSIEKSKATLGRLQEDVKSQKRRLVEIRRQIDQELGITLQETDDPGVILASQIEELTRQLSKLEQQVATINHQLSVFDTSPRLLDRLLRTSRTKTEIKQIEDIGENQEFKDLNAIRKECEQYAEDVELLIDALQRVTDAEAEKRLTNAQNTISTIFQKLTDRPDFPGLRVTPAKDGYIVEVTSASSSREALPILNQGDLNCAALSIFLALATASEISHQLGFIILDDPSQSLDTNGKTNLCKILDQVCANRQMLIGTVDEELRDEVLKITKNKNYYVIKAWDPTSGPCVELKAS